MHIFTGNKAKAKNISHIIAIFTYIALLHCLFIFIFKNTFKYSSEGKLFVYDFNIWKYMICLIETAIASYLVIKRSQNMGLENMVLLILYLFYFIPGFIYQAVVNENWLYIVVYFLYFLAMETFSRYIKTPYKIRNIIKKRVSLEIYIKLFFIICTILSIAFFAMHRKEFSLNNFLYTFSNVYEVRTNETIEVHWIIKNVELWVSYFGCLLITFYMTKKKFINVFILLFTETLMFMLYANRVILFFTLAAMLLGVIKINGRKIIFASTAMSLLVLIECLLSTNGGLLTNVFRRFSIVPNNISGFYFDFFIKNEPDYLRIVFPRIAKLLGNPSPYIQPNIAHIIAQTYFGRDFGANTGLVGGGFGTFGFASVILSPLGLILGLKLYEGAFPKIPKNNIYTTISVIFATLLINMSNLLSSMIRPSYFLMLFLSLLFWPDEQNNNIQTGNKIG